MKHLLGLGELDFYDPVAGTVLGLQLEPGEVVGKPLTLPPPERKWERGFTKGIPDGPYGVVSGKIDAPDPFKGGTKFVQFQDEIAMKELDLRLA
ncbi:MAG: hypothetical protein U0931_17865 [Vulcanimicrobiota bacterium]